MAAAAAEPHRRYICSFPGCEARYNKQWKLDAHLARHTGERPFRCGEPGCGGAFGTAQHLARHRLIHSGERSHRCDAEGCGQVFTTRSNLRRHAARRHGAGDGAGAVAAGKQRRSYGCAVEGCDLEFRKHQQLRSHMCEQHTGRPPYGCSFSGCSMRFTCPSKQRRHEKVHRGYPCKEEGCGFTGKTWTDLLKHRKEAHRPVFRCEQCDKEFRDTWFLHQHQRVHSEVRLVHKCPRGGCDRSFTTLFNLQSHISSFHECSRPFACTHAGCGKTFAMKQSLQRHSVAHDPERRRIAKPRRTRSLASRLSGFKPSDKAPRGKPGDRTDPAPGPGPEPRDLVSLLQDSVLLRSVVEERCGLPGSPGLALEHTVMALGQ